MNELNILNRKSYIQQITFLVPLSTDKTHWQHLYNTKSMQIKTGTTKTTWQLRGTGEVQECRKGGVKWKVGSYHQKNKLWFIWTSDRDRHWKTCMCIFLLAHSTTIIHTHTCCFWCIKVAGILWIWQNSVMIENESKKQTISWTFNLNQPRTKHSWWIYWYLTGKLIAGILLSKIY